MSLFYSSNIIKFPVALQFLSYIIKMTETEDRVNDNLQTPHMENPSNMFKILMNI